MTGEITYTAHFEKKAVEAPATRMVTAEYVAGKGGSVSRASETVDALAEGAAFLGSTAEAADGYAFVNWTAGTGFRRICVGRQRARSCRRGQIPRRNNHAPCPCLQIKYSFQ